MPDRPLTGLYTPRPRGDVVADLVTRVRHRLEARPDPAFLELLEDALFHERKRLERYPAQDGEQPLLDNLGAPAEAVDAADAAADGGVADDAVRDTRLGVWHGRDSIGLAAHAAEMFCDFCDLHGGDAGA